jgi:hypothetical protein
MEERQIGETETILTLVEGGLFWLFLAFFLVEGLQLGFGLMNAW